jgi:hypothetical protein
LVFVVLCVGCLFEVLLAIAISRCCILFSENVAEICSCCCWLLEELLDELLAVLLELLDDLLEELLAVLLELLELNELVGVYVSAAAKLLGVVGTYPCWTGWVCVVVVCEFRFTTSSVRWAWLGCDRPGGGFIPAERICGGAGVWALPLNGVAIFKFLAAW